MVWRREHFDGHARGTRTLDGSVSTGEPLSFDSAPGTGATRAAVRRYAQEVVGPARDARTRDRFVPVIPAGDSFIPQ